MAGRGAPPKDERKAERGNKQPRVRPRAQGLPHEGEPRPDPKTRRRHGESGSPPDHEAQARPRDTGRKGRPGKIGSGWINLIRESCSRSNF
jgi:hypothetical protein